MITLGINRLASGSGSFPAYLFTGGYSGFTDDPRRTDKIFTIVNGSTNVTALSDLVGRIEPIAGGQNLIQAVSASRTAWAGFPRGGVTQLLEYPQAVSNAAWTKTNCTPTDGQASYDGTNTATLLTVIATANSGIAQSPLAYSRVGMVSLMAKKGTAIWLRLFVAAATNNGIWFNLNTGVVGTVQANVQGYGITSIGDGWYSIYAYGTGTSNGGIRISNADNSTSGTAGTTLTIADPILATGTTVPTFQNRLGPSDITQTGLSTVNGYYADGVDDFLYLDAASWGTASQGMFATAGVNATMGAMYCGHDDAGVLYSQCGAVDANKMLEVSLSGGAPSSRIRGTANASATAFNNGVPHLHLTVISNGVVTTYIDGVASTPTVGAAAAETEKLAWMARTPSAPAGHLMGRCDPFLIDRALTASEAAQLWQYTKNYWGAV